MPETAKTPCTCQECMKDKLARACLAALARRTGKTGLVVRYDEIDYDFPDDEIDLVCDGDAQAVRITATWLPAKPEVLP
ncbi:MAG TPA: hypothetical protein VFA33_05865 [Bryobacteraceae bacterium]|nr:hypothetical protein [Bryobacteraceae bacterium]